MAQAPGIVDQGVNPDAESPQDMAAEPSGEPTPAQDEVAAQETPEVAETTKSGVAGAADAAEDQRTPQEQAEFDDIMTLAYKIMYSEKGFGVLLYKLSSDKNDVGYNYGHTLAMIMLSIQKTARVKGHEYSVGMMFEAGLEVLSDLMKIGISSGMVKKEFEEKVMTRALFSAFKIYGDNEIKAGNIREQDMQAATSEISSLGLDPQAAMDATGSTENRKVQDHADQMMKDHPPGSSQPSTQQPPPAPAAAPAAGAPTGGIVNQVAGA